MQSIIRKVKSMPSLMKFSPLEERRARFKLPYSQLSQQVDELEELIDIMISESWNNTAIQFSSPSNHSDLFCPPLLKRIFHHRESNFLFILELLTYS